MKDLIREAQLEEIYQFLKAAFMKTKQPSFGDGASLTADEKAYLRKFIAEHLEFYRTVVECGHPTAGNLKLYELLKGIWEKLQ
jgi:hypothetical protein